jgi:hypothetical protein
MKEKRLATSGIRRPAEKPERTRTAPRADAAELVMERFGTFNQMDRSFDIAYWQRHGDAAIFRAAWELGRF